MKIISNVMIVHRKLIAIVFTSILFICCKENNPKTNNIDQISKTEIQNTDITIWQLQDVTRFFDEALVEADVDNFKKNKVYFDKNTLRINDAEANFSLKKRNP